MAVGSVVTVQGADVCLTGATGAASEYTIVAYNSSPDGATILSTNALAWGSPPAVDADGSVVGRTVPLAVALRRHGGAHESARPDLPPAPALQLEKPEAAVQPRALDPQRTPLGQSHFERPAVPLVAVVLVDPVDITVGEIVRLNVASSSCSDAVIRAFRVTAVGAKAVVLADTLNPANGFSDVD